MGNLVRERALPFFPQNSDGECIMRTATTNGLVLLTFTPLEGMSEVVMSFMPKEMQPGEGLM